MKLSKQEVDEFYELYHHLLFYVNKKLNINKKIKSRGDIWKIPLEEINEIRNRLYKKPELIGSFVRENPFKFSDKELEIIKNWKNFVKGNFIVLRYMKNYTIFLDAQKPMAYGVLALQSSFEEILPFLPVAVDAVLLPFKNNIIYDSLLNVYNITFGGGIKRELNEAFQKAKMMFGIVTSLPPPEEKKLTDADKLKFYLRNRTNREIYAEEIERLINKDETLLTIYHQEMGKYYARKYKKKLMEIGIKKGWFALLDGLIVGSGKNKKEVEENILNMVPKEKRKFVYIFGLGGKK